VDPNDARDLYRKMYLIRAVELIGARWSREGRCTNPPHFSVGAEAAAVGVMSALKPEDYLYVYHRCHAPFIAKGGRLSVLKEALLGTCTRPGATGSMHLADDSAGVLGGSAIIGGALPIAAGAAWVCKMEGNGRRVVCWVGDTAWDCGYFWETLGVARRLALPLLIVVDGNGISTSSSAYSCPLADIEETIQAFGHDVSNVADKSALALKNLPDILTISTRRYCAHAGGVLERPLGDDMDPIAQFDLPEATKAAIEADVNDYLRANFE
jgi:TPP-dependent pyruvate/acetoin dehydrogenase alpha subunit